MGYAKQQSLPISIYKQPLNPLDIVLSLAQWECGNITQDPSTFAYALMILALNISTKMMYNIYNKLFLQFFNTVQIGQEFFLWDAI